MDEKETLFKTNIGLTLAQNEEYFRNIFKKTEKIVSAVFYIASIIKDQSAENIVIDDVEESGRRLIEHVLKTLSVRQGARYEIVDALRFALIDLESRLRLLGAIQLLPREHLEVFLGEIDTVQRSLNRFLAVHQEQSFFFAPSTTSPQQRHRIAHSRNTLPSKNAVEGGSASHQDINRTDRILSILKDKGEATIKDISLLITDCSEKTIQRELNELIKDSRVVREGERRWSKYKAV